MKKPVVLLLLIASLALSLSAHQTASAGSGSISGTVVDSAGKPVSGWPVIAERLPLTVDPATGRADQDTMTDATGAYRFDRLPAGPYRVKVRAWTRTFPIPSTLTVKSGAFEAAPVPRGPVTIVDADGGHFLQIVGPSSVTKAETHPRVAVTTYAGGATRPAGASTTTVTAGKEQRNVDITVAQPPTVRVDGVVTATTGPVARAAVRLYLDRSELDVDHPIFSATAFTDGDGRFLFMALAPGPYVVDVERPLPPQDEVRLTATGFPATMSHDYFAGSDLLEYLPETTLTVDDSDLHGVSLKLRKGAQITGTVVVLKPMKLANGELIPPIFVRLGGLSRPIPPAGRSTFVIDDVKPGKYTLHVGALLQGFEVIAATLDGRDVKSTPIEVGWSGVKNLLITIGDDKSLVVR